jgi:hypothetical protein
LNWTTEQELRAQVQRHWDRGELLRAAAAGTMAWPLRLVLRGPASSDVADRFEAVRGWAAAIAASPRIRIEWRESQHRVQGRQRLPVAAWVDTLEDALALIGQTPAAERFRELWRRTQVAAPTLLPWLEKRPLQVLELSDRWERLLAVLAWIRANPRPDVYLRQVDVQGVDSKFIEAHRGVLTEWLDLVLPADLVEAAASGTAQFSRRFGFREKPVRLRLRVLDAALPSLPGLRGLPDITLDAASFAALALPVSRVFITENETNFLAFPPKDGSIVLFGAGYGWEALAPAAWLHRCDLRYWGDIDTHGFAILHQLRALLPRVSSFLMDRETLMAHRDQWGEEQAPLRHGLANLTVEEAALYDELRFDSIRTGLRLEQERIGFGWCSDRLARI